VATSATLISLYRLCDYFPVLPNPPSPLSVWVNSSTSSNSTFG
jgi:hypothetical protein